MPSERQSGTDTRQRRSACGNAAFVLAFLTGAGALNACKPVAGHGAPVQPPQAVTIKVADAHLGDMSVYIDALGSVTPVATVNLYSQVNGRVTAVHYKEGQMVKRGDPLIDIDARPYAAQLQEAQGTLRHDQGLLAQAELDLTRYKSASDQQAIARQTYEDQKELVEQYRGTVQNDTGQVEYARVQLSYCHLVSPVGGRVGLRLIDPGNTVFSGNASPLVVVTQMDPITVVFDVAEDDLDQVREVVSRREPLPVLALDRSRRAQLATGELLTLDNQIDTSTGTVRFRAWFGNADLKLFPNQFVNTRLQVKTLKGAVLIPSAAVQRNGAQAFVYLVAGRKAVLHPLTEMASEGDTTAVTGLHTGDKVAVTGFNNLQDGSLVQVVPGSMSDVGTRPSSGQVP